MAAADRPSGDWGSAGGSIRLQDGKEVSEDGGEREKGADYITCGRWIWDGKGGLGAVAQG